MESGQRGVSCADRHLHPNGSVPGSSPLPRLEQAVPLFPDQDSHGVGFEPERLLVFHVWLGTGPVDLLGIVTRVREEEPVGIAGCRRDLEFLVFPMHVHGNMDMVVGVKPALGIPPHPE